MTKCRKKYNGVMIPMPKTWAARPKMAGLVAVRTTLKKPKIVENTYNLTGLYSFDFLADSRSQIVYIKL